MGSNSGFEGIFEVLTGHKPFPWQKKLYHEHLAKGDLPAVCDLPTGLGKTSVIATWLIALAEQIRDGRVILPRRLVYVVNRRTVVDQTTREAEHLKTKVETGKLPGIHQLAISTLRGQFADNAEWSADPSLPAVICGTVDMIGSRLLFEGYRIGFRSRPLHAGFLGQDALVVHDEAHLEPAFQKLIETIQCEQGNCRVGNNGTCVRCGKRERPRDFRPLHVMALSATARSNTNNGDGTFGLKGPDYEHPIVMRRVKASKSLHLHPCEDEKKKLVANIVERATTPVYLKSNSAILVFVRLVQDAEDVAEALRKTLKSAKLPEHVATLTGTMRGLERDDLVRNPVFIRFLQDSDRPDNVESAEGTVYLVCTSAGEVGVNVSADHMVCDLSTFDSMAQRLGRVNRFGDRKDTRVDVVYPESFGKVDKKTGELKANEIDKQRARTLELLRKLDKVGKNEDDEPIYDASPKALGELPADERLAAFAPEPTILPATDILFDAWALTTIKSKMPGRPPVAPYLHGVADDLPQTTIAWRAELKLIDPESPDAEKTLQAIFRKHRIRPHETLATNSYRVADFLKKLKKRTDLHDTFVALQFPRNLRLMKIGKLIDDPGPLNAEPSLVLPASFGGLDEKGSLSADAVRKNEKPRDESESADTDEDAATEDAGTSTPTLDIADHDGYEPYEKVPPRIRVLIVRSDDGWSVRAMPGGRPLPDDWDFDETYETSTKLVNAIRKQSGLNVRLVQAIKQNEEGDDIRSLVCLSPAPQEQQNEEQSLADHVDAVEIEAERLAKELQLPEPYRSALLFAAKWHDEGKKASIWQRYIGRPNDDGELLGKSATWRDPKLLAGYRHEFGSLLRLEHPTVWQSASTLPDDEDVKDLGLHLIAAHHGYGRPHFKNTVVEGFTPQQEEAAHVEIMQRYARLQRRYGRWGLVYLESLLRAADAAASRAVGIDPEADDDDTEEGDA